MLKVQPSPSHLVVNKANTVSAKIICYMCFHAYVCSLLNKISMYISVKWLMLHPFMTLRVTYWVQLKAQHLKHVLICVDA